MGGTVVDVPGAHPGAESEERGIAEAIARSIGLMSRLRTPIVTVITGEGGSGGALAIGVGDVVLALENAVYSVISPEGCASILWRSRDEARTAIPIGLYHAGATSAPIHLDADFLVGPEAAQEGFAGGFVHLETDLRLRQRESQPRRVEEIALHPHHELFNLVASWSHSAPLRAESGRTAWLTPGTARRASRTVSLVTLIKSPEFHTTYWL